VASVVSDQKQRQTDKKQRRKTATGVCKLRHFRTPSSFNLPLPPHLTPHESSILRQKWLVFSIFRIRKQNCHH
ncbi:MAG: hypothetical protein ACKPHU_14435, partial [Planctomycetaceae bacterium]